MVDMLILPREIGLFKAECRIQSRQGWSSLYDRAPEVDQMIQVTSDGTIPLHR